MAFIYSEIENSSFLDLAGYRITDATSVEQAYGLTDGQPLPLDESFVVNVALVLPRANDPTDLLAGDWGSRQQALQQLRDDGTLWSTYGADQGQFDNAVSFLKDELGLVVLDASNSNYVTSAESRTIWVQLETPGQFETLFNVREFSASMAAGGSLAGYWHGNLSLPEELTVEGLAFDYEAQAPASNLTPGVSATLPQGPQSLGNSSALDPESSSLMPQDMAAQYDFPLDGLKVETKTVGLIEPGIGSALKGDPMGTTFQSRLDQLMAGIGRDGDGTVVVQGINGQSPTTYGERSMDVSMIAATNPNSDIVLLVGSGYATAGSQSTPFTALQSAVFPGEGMPHIPVWSSSFLELQGISPNSPFYRAYQELYVDTALANQTAVSAADDGGSGEQIGNGLTNLAYNHTQPYNLLVGGSSLSSLGAAKADPTLMHSIVAPALAADPATIWRLVVGGLQTLPANMSSSEFQFFVETPWNTYTVQDKEISNYLNNNATSGGVDPTQPVPSYQVAYGLNPTTSDPLAQVGRGSPDVTINAGGNGFYQSGNVNLTEFGGYYLGTSAASPMWAALIAQIDTIFEDQGLPDLGYAHDLLYTASAIAPASFNDVTMGNNISSFVYGGSYTTNDGKVPITPTGFGYYAGPGYDLVSGLGSPNGTVLARTLSAAAHSQMFFSDEPDTIVGSLTDGWTSGVAQSLLFQTMSGKGVNVDVTIGDGGFDYTSGASATFAWTSRLAMQSLDPDFDADLVRLFDKHRQGAESQRDVAAGDVLEVSIDGIDAQAIQAGLTSSFGFADFMASDGVVRVARAVAVAETAGGADDQAAIVRIRQNGQDTLGVTFYKVDDLAGTINGIAPGQAGYAAAVQDNAYQLATGGTMLTGPGYGMFAQNVLLNVDAGDLVAMTLHNVTHGDTYRAFSKANPDGQGHLWNYGLNTWGWEDTRGGGDHDFNDLIVQLDFTSASGSGWLV